MKATCYHLRNQAGVKVLGGSIGLADSGPDLNAAAARITNELDIIVTPSGRLSFAKDGKPVFAYLSVDPAETEKGQAVLAAYRNERARAQQLEAEQEAANEDALNDAVGAIGIERALELLRAAQKAPGP